MFIPSILLAKKLRYAAFFTAFCIIFGKKETTRRAMLGILFMLFFAQNTTAQEARTLTLAQAQEMALANSAQIKKARLDRAILEHKFNEQRSAALPQVKAGIHLDIFPAVPTQYVPGTLLNRPNESFVAVPFGQPFQLTGGIQAEQLLYSEAGRRMLPAAEISRQLSEILITRTEDEVRYQTAQVWLQTLQMTQLVRSVDANLDKLAQLQGMAELQYTNGYITSTDVKRIKVARTNLATQKQQLLNGIVALTETLQFLCGIAFEQKTTVRESTAAVAADSSQWANMPLETDNLLEIRLLGLQTRLNEVQQHAAQPSLRPEVRAYAQTWVQHQSNNLNVFGEGWRGMGMVGIKAETTLYDGKKSRHKLAQLDIERQKIAEDLRLLEAAKTLEYRQAKTQLRAALDGLVVQRENMALAQEVTDKLALRYKAGEAPLSDLLNAQTARTEAETNYWQQVFGYKLAVLRLARVCGKLVMVEE